MSDLSRLLGDVYGGTALDSGAGGGDSVDDAVVEEARSLPDWADDDTLDEAFAGWVPGPPEGAPAAEHAAMEGAAASGAAHASVSFPLTPGPGTDEGHDESGQPAADDTDGWLFGLTAATDGDSVAEALTTPQSAIPTAPGPATPPATVTGGIDGMPWSRTQDDVLPSGGGGFRLRRR